MSRRLCNDDKLIINNECVEVDETTESAVTFIEERVYIEVPNQICYGQKPYIMRFTQADLIGSLLPVVHGLFAADGVVNITLVNDNRDQVEPTNVTFVNENLAHISLDGYTPISNTWIVRAS